MSVPSISGATIAYNYQPPSATAPATSTPSVAQELQLLQQQLQQLKSQGVSNGQIFQAIGPNTYAQSQSPSISTTPQIQSELAQLSQTLQQLQSSGASKQQIGQTIGNALGLSKSHRHHQGGGQSPATSLLSALTAPTSSSTSVSNGITAPTSSTLGGPTSGPSMSTQPTSTSADLAAIFANSFAISNPSITQLLASQQAAA